MRKGDKVSVIKECIIPGYIVTPKAKGKIISIYDRERKKALVEFEICGLKIQGSINCINLKTI